MKKKRGAPFASFEGQSKEGRHVRLTRSMILHPAWRALKPTSVKLYVHLKLRYGGNPHELNFTCTYKEINQILGFNDRAIKSAFDDLSKKGFIEVVENNRYVMRANVYKFSDKWQTFEPPRAARDGGGGVRVPYRTNKTVDKNRDEPAP